MIPVDGYTRLFEEILRPSFIIINRVPSVCEWIRISDKCKDGYGGEANQSPGLKWYIFIGDK